MVRKKGEKGNRIVFFSQKNCTIENNYSSLQLHNLFSNVFEYPLEYYCIDVPVKKILYGILSDDVEKSPKVHWIYNSFSNKLSVTEYPTAMLLAK